MCLEYHLLAAAFEIGCPKMLVSSLIAHLGPLSQSLDHHHCLNSNGGSFHAEGEPSVLSSHLGFGYLFVKVNLS